MSPLINSKRSTRSWPHVVWSHMKEATIRSLASHRVWMKPECYCRKCMRLKHIKKPSNNPGLNPFSSGNQIHKSPRIRSCLHYWPHNFNMPEMFININELCCDGITSAPAAAAAGGGSQMWGQTQVERRKQLNPKHSGSRETLWVHYG